MVNQKNDKFARTRLMLGQAGLDKLKSATINIIGLGAVGGYVVEGLARAGVGNLNLIDFDKVEPSNINRQVIALESTIGQDKTKLMQDRVKDINPNCKTTIKNLFINEESVCQIKDLPCNFTVDAIDSLSSKVALLELLLDDKMPFISSMGAARRTDPSFIKIGSLNQITNCPLAKFVRKRLKRRKKSLSFNCVYSDEPSKEALGDLENNQEQTTGRQRRAMGSLPTITAIFDFILQIM